MMNNSSNCVIIEDDDDDDSSNSIVICKRALYLSVAPEAKRYRSTRSRFTMADALVLLSSRRDDDVADDKDEDSDADEAEENSSSSAATYNLIVLADRVLDRDDVCRWVPAKTLVLQTLSLEQQLEIEDDENDVAWYRVIECDDCEATLAMLIGVASFVTKHVAVVSNLSLARRCAKLIDGASDCSACVFDSVDKLESHVRALFDDDNDDDDDEENDEFTDENGHDDEQPVWI